VVVVVVVALACGVVGRDMEGEGASLLTPSQSVSQSVQSVHVLVLALVLLCSVVHRAHGDDASADD
jgi:hypothetical protein